MMNDIDGITVSRKKDGTKLNNVEWEWVPEEGTYIFRGQLYQK